MPNTIRATSRRRGRVGNRWEPTRPLAIRRVVGDDGGVHAEVPFGPVSRTHRIKDPVVGDTILAVTGIGKPRGLIRPQDFAEFDALFIRETTSVNHHTYRFASRAAAEGLVVIDDPTSIVRCSNKVYQAELFQRHGMSPANNHACHTYPNGVENSLGVIWSPT